MTDDYKIYVDAGRPATLNNGAGILNDCATLQEAVLAWHRLAPEPKEHATGLIGFAAQIRRSSLIGSCAMETAEHGEPCESRGSRTDLGAPGGEIPPGDST
jgi:hypothetical protein